jgi:Ca-activated chloride channel family protein
MAISSMPGARAIRSRRVAGFGAAGIIVVFLVGGCGGAGSPSATSAATPAATESGVPSATPAAAVTPAPSASASAEANASSAPGGPATLDAPAQVSGGSAFAVTWTGPKGPSDYVTIVAVGTDKWTNQPYFDATAGSPGRLVAPTTAGAYELWYVSNADGAILSRRPIAVTPFEGSLAGPATVQAGSSFMVGWTGPNGPNDYVTIVAPDAQKWTNESYFDTSAGSPGPLVAPIKAGDYELWYVAGTDAKTMVRAPIAVTPYAVTLDAPDSVAKGATFQVTWTGPNGPSDYITIAPAGSPDGTYLNYAYTSAGSPATLTAPDKAGSYEIRYASDRVTGTFESIPITVK